MLYCLFLNEDLSDVHFTFSGETRRIPGHKVILAQVSDMFKTQFYRENRAINEIQIHDASAAAFEEFLSLIYRNHLDITVEMVKDIMGMAYHYNVEDGLRLCDEFLEDVLSNEHILLKFECAVCFERDRVRRIFAEEIANRPENAFESTRFLNCEHRVLRAILEIRYLLCDPKYIFDKCFDWARNACRINRRDPNVMENRKNMLGQCFYLIPFNLMMPQQI